MISVFVMGGGISGFFSSDLCVLIPPQVCLSVCVCISEMDGWILFFLHDLSYFSVSKLFVFCFSFGAMRDLFASTGFQGPCEVVTKGIVWKAVPDTHSGGRVGGVPWHLWELSWKM